MKSLVSQYGPKKGETIFYKMRAEGKITGVEAKKKKPSKTKPTKKGKK